LLQRTPTEGSYQQSLFGKFLVWSLLILGTVAVQDYRTSLGDFTVSEGHGYPLVSLMPSPEDPSLVVALLKHHKIGEEIDQLPKRTLQCFFWKTINHSFSQKKIGKILFS